MTKRWDVPSNVALDNTSVMKPPDRNLDVAPLGFRVGDNAVFVKLEFLTGINSRIVLCMIEICLICDPSDDGGVVKKKFFMQLPNSCRSKRNKYCSDKVSKSSRVKTIPTILYEVPRLRIRREKSSG